MDFVRLYSIIWFIVTLCSPVVTFSTQCTYSTSASTNFVTRPSELWRRFTYSIMFIRKVKRFLILLHKWISCSLSSQRQTRLEHRSNWAPVMTVFSFEDAGSCRVCWRREKWNKQSHLSRTRRCLLLARRHRFPQCTRAPKQRLASRVQTPPHRWPPLVLRALLRLSARRADLPTVGSIILPDTPAV